MKKLFLAVLIAASIGTSAFAADATHLNYRVKSAFEAAFAGATNVSWHIKPQFISFAFELNNEKMEAFYSSDGEQIGTSRHVSFDKLPASAVKKIKANYPDYQVKEAVKMDLNGESNYYVSLENGNLKRILEVSEYGRVSLFNNGK
ncbi:hypothetical protein [Asinibacterium sp. OR53]|uniref:hypothetical protein n=1 Tax=Asinibacterium sp. OR53 TaxID=925409 RepID=UPI00047DDB27|nr:hypothetical protein [Asinibacterium sp. OR53]